MANEREKTQFGKAELVSKMTFEFTAADVYKFMQYRFNQVAKSIFDAKKAEWERNGRNPDYKPVLKEFRIGCAPRKFESRTQVYTPFYLLMPGGVNKGSKIPNIAEAYQEIFKEKIVLIPEYWAIIAPLVYSGKFKNWINDPGAGKSKAWEAFGMNNRNDVERFLKLANVHRFENGDKNSKHEMIGIALDPIPVLKTMVTKLMMENFPDKVTDNIDISVDLNIKGAVKAMDYKYKVEIVTGGNKDNADDGGCMRALLEMINGEGGKSTKASSRYGK